MKILILGAAGYVGTILRPAFDAEHEAFYSDMNPIPGAENRSLVCDIEDTERLAPHFAGVDSVVYLPYGRAKFRDTHDVNLGFNVNVRAVYKCAQLALQHAVPSFVYASTLSVFNNFFKDPPLPEDRTPDAGNVYGITKWLGEQVCQILSRNQPKTTFLMLRLILPRQESEWTAAEKFDPSREKNLCCLGPNDTRRLFLAAVKVRQPGFHIVHASGDLTGKIIPNTTVKSLLGWEPRNE
ncbi:MAG TPA: NAD(P)-dependent oxidoreductase [Tepidisphaeraceae bacterium]|nr:NAD(P)-dependent oxidoreductase [Tepidisphaeraceae bacterium]